MNLVLFSTIFGGGRNKILGRLQILTHNLRILPRKPGRVECPAPDWDSIAGGSLGNEFHFNLDHGLLHSLKNHKENAYV